MRLEDQFLLGRGCRVRTGGQREPLLIVCTSCCLDSCYQPESNAEPCDISQQRESLCPGHTCPLCSDKWLIWWYNSAPEMPLLRWMLVGQALMCSVFGVSRSVGSCCAAAGPGIRGKGWLSAEPLHSLLSDGTGSFLQSLWPQISAPYWAVREESLLLYPMQQLRWADGGDLLAGSSSCWCPLVRWTHCEEKRWSHGECG